MAEKEKLIKMNICVGMCVRVMKYLPDKKA